MRIQGLGVECEDNMHRLQFANELLERFSSFTSNFFSDEGRQWTIYESTAEYLGQVGGFMSQKEAFIVVY